MLDIASKPVVRFAPPAIGTGEIDEVIAALQSGWLTTGPRVHAFEQAFAASIGARHAVAVNSCTAGLHLSLVVAGIGPGDEVITTPLTFCATANAILHAGATPVFADIDPVTMNIDPRSVESALTPRTRAVLPVHFAGRPVDVSALQALAVRHALLLIDDAAHAAGAVSNGGPVGATADFTCFSFYATKNLTTGEGGMVTTARTEWAEQLRTASLHGLTRNAWSRYSATTAVEYDVVTAGFKYNMTDIQAALGLRQLARLDDMNRRRAQIWRRYDEAFRGLPVSLPASPESGTRHARHLYTILIDRERCGVTRSEAAERLGAEGIATAIHFRALHLHTYYRERLRLRRGMFPNAEYVSDRTLSLPLSASMTDDEVARVVDAMHEVFS